jgi:hypothetical protein
MTRGWIDEFVDSVYCICLPQRAAYVQGIMRQLQIEPVYVQPVLKSELPDTVLDDNQIVQRSAMNSTDRANLNKARVACHLSHLAAVKLFLDTAHEKCLILEDDIWPEFTLEKLKLAFAHLREHLPHDWNFVNLGRCWADCASQIHISRILVRSDRMFCRHAYMLNRSGAEVMSRHLMPMKKAGGDVIVLDLIRAGLLTGLAVTPRFFGQNRSRLGSLLGNDGDLRECADGSF